jgi:hypothetical protein
MASYPTVASMAPCGLGKQLVPRRLIGCLHMVTNMRLTAVWGIWRTIWLPSEARGRR